MAGRITRTLGTTARAANRFRNARGRLNWLAKTALLDVESDRSVVLGPRAVIAVRNGGKAEFGSRVVIREEFSGVIEGTLIVGNDVFIGRGGVISCLDRISIGDGVRLGERTSIHDENHVIEPIAERAGRIDEYDVAPVAIGARVWLGANVVVLPGASIGDDSVIAAGSVVQGAIPAGVLAAGSPAVVKRHLK